MDLSVNNNHRISGGLKWRISGPLLRESKKNKICPLFEIYPGEIYTVRFNRWNRYRNISGSRERIRNDSQTGSEYRGYFYRSRENSTQNATFQHEHEHGQTHDHFSFHRQFLKTSQSNL